MKVIKRLGRRIRAVWYTLFSQKRKYPRVPISVKVTNLDSGSFTYYHAANISVGGMFLRADNPHSPGARLKLSFSLGENGDIETDAEVVREHVPGPDDPYPSGVGIKFLGLSRESRDMIRAFVEKRT